MKVFIWVVANKRQDYTERTQGAKLCIIAHDLPEAMRLMDSMLPKAVNVNALMFREAMHNAKPQVFEAEGFTELTMNNGYKTESFVHAQKVGVS